MPFNKETLLSLEFLIAVLASAAAWLVSLTSESTLSHRDALIINVVAAAFLALSRGLAKQNADTKSYWKTTEFWVAVVAAVQIAIADNQNLIHSPFVKNFGGFLAAALAVAQGLRKVPGIQASGATPTPDAYYGALDFKDGVVLDPALDGDDTLVAQTLPSVPQPKTDTSS